MNILHIIPNLTKGGAERICLDIANEIQSRKEHNYLLVLLDEENEYQELSSNTNLKVTSSKLKLKVFGKDNNDLDDLQNIVDDFKPDIIHSHLFLAELFSKHIISDAKRFAHVHDNMHQLENVSLFNINSKSYLVKYFERKYYDRLADSFHTHFLCISNDAKKFVEKNLSNISISIIKFPNAINTETFNPEDLRNPDEINLVNIGSFVPKKAQTLLVDTVFELKKLTPKQVNMHFLGDGGMKNDCIEQSENLGIKENISFHGKVNNPEDFLKKSDLYLHSAIYEPFGLVLIEAMSTGTPVITTDGKGNRDFMTDGNGILLDHRDPKQFSKQIMDLLNNDSKYNQLRQGALDTAKAYDIGPYVDRLIDLYKTI